MSQQASFGDSKIAPQPDTEGKKVFRPSELNQAGEDKEYFSPKDGRKFNVPPDANEHALTPDIEITPDHKIKTID